MTDLDLTRQYACASELLNYTDDMLCMIDLDLRYVAVNKSYAQMFDKPCEYFFGRTISEAFAHDPVHYSEVILPITKQCLAGEKVHYERWVEVPRLGKQYMDIKYTPVRDSAGAISGIAVSGRNRTDIVRSLEALKRSEAMLNRTERIAKLGGWGFDVKTGSIQWTDEMYAIHEVGRDFELTQENVNSFIDPEYLNPVLENLEKSTQGIPTESVLPLNTPTGKQKWVRSIAFPVFENGVMVSLEGILQDITELTNMQLLLRQSEEKYRNLVEDTNVIVWECGYPPEPPGFQYMSPRAETLTGYSMAELLSPDFLVNHVHPEDLQASFDKVLQFTSAREDFSLEYRLFRADGSLMWIHDEIKIIFDHNANPVKMRGVMVDITIMKTMQSGLRKALRELENHKYIVDQHAIASITDSSGRIVNANEKFLESTGYEREDLIGQNHSMLRSDHHPASFYSTLWETILAGDVWQGEICNRKRDGQLFWVYTTIVPIKDENGTIEEFMSLRTDITELKRTEESLRRAQKMDAIGQLTGGIAHDFNNLLSIVIGNLELIETALPPNQVLLTQLENARNAALRGSVLTRRLLNFSRQTPVPGKSLNLNQIIRGLGELISKSLTALVTIQMDLAQDLWVVEVDAGDFEDAIINLALNASDAMPLGGNLVFRSRNYYVMQTGFIGSSQIPAGQYVEIVVEDTGIGMSQEIMEKIFEPYFTTKSSDKGTGLGLAMVYGFVKRSNGLIHIESSSGKGACFTMLLPRSSHKAEHLFEVKTATTLSKSTRNDKTILVVDDEGDILKIVRFNLEHLGYGVLCCGSVEEALTLLRSDTHIDLLFTDVVMPGKLNGYELGAAAQSLRPKLKILYTTGYAKVEKTMARDYQPENMLKKPYRGAELACKISEMLGA